MSFGCFAPQSGKITLIYTSCVNRRVNRVNHSKSYLLQV